MSDFIHSDCKPRRTPVGLLDAIVRSRTLTSYWSLAGRTDILTVQFSNYVNSPAGCSQPAFPDVSPSSLEPWNPSALPSWVGAQYRHLPAMQGWTPSGLNFRGLGRFLFRIRPARARVPTPAQPYVKTNDSDRVRWRTDLQSAPMDTFASSTASQTSQSTQHPGRTLNCFLVHCASSSSSNTSTRV